MKEKVTLFITYIEFFHKLHKKYLKRFTTKLQLLISQLNYDIKFEDNEKPELSKKNALSSLKNEINDKSLLKSLKSNMSDNDELSVISEIYNKSKSPSDESLSNSSERSSSDASEKLFLNDYNSDNSDNSDNSNNTKLNDLQDIQSEIKGPKVQFNNNNNFKQNKSHRNNNKNNHKKNEKIKGIIKSKSEENIAFNIDNDNTNITIEDISLIEKQSPNDECLSAITTDSKDEYKQDIPGLLEPEPEPEPEPDVDNFIV
jgi:hypothetical protein